MKVTDWRQKTMPWCYRKMSRPCEKKGAVRGKGRKEEREAATWEMVSWSSAVCHWEEFATHRVSVVSVGAWCWPSDEVYFYGTDQIPLFHISYMSWLTSQWSSSALLLPFSRGFLGTPGKYFLFCLNKIYFSFKMVHKMQR